MTDNYPTGIASFSTLILNNSTISSNTGDNGGSGIYSSGLLTANDSTITNNTTDFFAYGAGIYNDAGTLQLVNSTVSNNDATDGGWGGGIYNSGGNITLTNRTLSGNSAVNGGGIYFYQGLLDMTNVTVSGNMASSEGGGIYNRAAGIVDLANVTFANNSATSSGGAILNNGTATLTNSILANSPSGGDCAGSGSVISSGHNLDSDGTCGLGAAGDLTNADPLVGPLSDNGGPTLTHALLFGSLAIDAADTSACPSTDQRGVLRPWTGGCDIGAFEVSPFAPSVPGLSQWALMILAALLAGLAFARVRRQLRPVPASLEN